MQDKLNIQSLVQEKYDALRKGDHNRSAVLLDTYHGDTRIDEIRQSHGIAYKRSPSRR